MVDKIKRKGVVYTPSYIVDLILDQSNYKGENILNKHVIDNSCGDGAFLERIVLRYIEEFIKKHELNSNTRVLLKKELETYIHGIEIDKSERDKAIDNLDKIVVRYDIPGVKWDIMHGDTLKINKYDNKMDFVLGNPPYVRIHNLGPEYEFLKKSKFTKIGMTDLFIIFYELGLNMLNKTGTLSYITPSSIFNSLAGREFRKYIDEKRILSSVIDFKHYQVFNNVTTYTTILTINKGTQSEYIAYYRYDKDNQSVKFIDYLSYHDFSIANKWYFSEKNKLKELRKMSDKTIQKQQIKVKNGFATLADKIFIKEDFGFNSKYIYKVIKASTGKAYNIFYPYDKKGNVVPFEELEPPLQKYLISNKETLLNRSRDKNTEWYAFGRKQGVIDFFKPKIAVNTLVRNKKDIKIKLLNPGEGIYSGLYIVGDFDYNTIIRILKSDDFIEYISILGKYKSGGYYTYSSSDLNKFINYKLERGEELICVFCRR